MGDLWECLAKLEAQRDQLDGLEGMPKSIGECIHDRGGRGGWVCDR